MSIFAAASLQDVAVILLAARDLLARELAGRDRVHALDALRHVAVGDALHLQHVQAAQLGDLLEGQRGVLDQPHGGCFRHQEFAVTHRGPFRDRQGHCPSRPRHAGSCAGLRAYSASQRGHATAVPAPAQKSCTAAPHASPDAREPADEARARQEFARHLRLWPQITALPQSFRHPQRYPWRQTQDLLRRKLGATIFAARHERNEGKGSQ